MPGRRHGRGVGAALARHSICESALIHSLFTPFRKLTNFVKYFILCREETYTYYRPTNPIRKIVKCFCFVNALIYCPDLYHNIFRKTSITEKKHLS